MNIKPIKTEEDYRTTLEEIESLMTAEPGTPEGERLDVLVTLVEAYERKHYPIDLPDPVEAIKFVMEQHGLTVKDLEPHDRPLQPRVRGPQPQAAAHPQDDLEAAHKTLGIPAESLIKQTDESEAA